VDAFLKLGGDDALSIDSSHTVKTEETSRSSLSRSCLGSRAAWLIHFHDISLPWDYPAEWVIAARVRPEEHMVRSFLAFNSAFSVVLSADWLHQFRAVLLREPLRGYPQTYRKRRRFPVDPAQP
jgi:hypothetical protein